MILEIFLMMAIIYLMCVIAVAIITIYELEINEVVEEIEIVNFVFAIATGPLMVLFMLISDRIKKRQNNEKV